MQSDQVANPIQYILNSPLSGVLSQGFAELYKKKPDFPVSYLANWLKEYSRNNKNKIESAESVKRNTEIYKQLQQEHANKKSHQQKEERQFKNQNDRLDGTYTGQLKKTKHLADLLRSWLPEYFENRYKMTGVYVGHLTHPHKALQLHNFSPDSQFDSESPKIVQYIGTSASHQSIMHMKILPNQTGISYEVFNEPQPEPEVEQQQGEVKKQKPVKKTYIYVPDVTKNEKIHYFKFPRLGSYACFPLKLKSYLTENSLEQGVDIYKQYVKQKEETQKEYKEKLNEVKSEYEEALKKFQEFEAPEEPNPDSQNEKAALKQELDKTHEAFKEVENAPPVIPDPEFPTIEIAYLIGIDTLGKDQKISEETLDKIDAEIKLFKAQFQAKQKQMLLDDILAYIDDEGKLDSLENTYRDIEKNALSVAEETAKEKTNKEKELQFQTSVAKCKKMESVFQESGFEKSMKTYQQYNIPKFKQILQIGLMLVRFPKEEINLSRSNQLNFRKIISEEYIEKLMEKISQYNLRPVETQQCHEEYKISKLLQRLQKIDLEQVIKYNAFIWALAMHLKNMCWCRLQCRDSHIQAYQLSVKAKEERDAEIQKYKEEFQKALEAQKAEVAGQGGQNTEQFNEQEWVSNYKKDNTEPSPLQILEQKQFLDLE